MSLNFPDPLITNPWTDPNGVKWDYTAADGWRRDSTSMASGDPYIFSSQPGSISLGKESPLGTGVDNTIVGLETGTNLAASNNNTFVGAYAGVLLSVAEDNVINGAHAGEALIQALTNSNVIVGAWAAPVQTKLQNNVILGAYAEPLGDDEVNEIVIGATAIGDGSNTTVIGDANTQEARIEGALTIGSFTIDALPNPSPAGRIIIVTGIISTTGAPRLCVSDGVSWFPFSLDAAVTP